MSLRLILPLHKATHQIGLFVARQRALEVSQAEAHVLAFLGEQGGAASLRALHRSFGHRPSTLTSLTDRLEGRGLLRREIHPEDRRSFLLRLTPRGRARARAVLRALGKLEARTRAAVSERQIEAYRAVLEAMGGAAED